MDSTSPPPLLHDLQVTSLGICELQLNEKVRQKSFRAMVRQDISWFDLPENSVSVLTHKLSTEASAISQVSKHIMV